MFWADLKIWIETATGLDRDALHIYIALIIQLGVAIFFRKRLASIWPWLTVLIVELVNEYFDYRQFWELGSLPDHLYEEFYKDIWNTMLAPTMLLLIANLWPGWLVPKQKTVYAEPEADEFTEEAEI